MSENRRKYHRVSFACPVTICTPDGSHDNMIGTTEDIGLGGLCTHLPSGIAKGKKVEIQVHFLGTARPFKCSGKIVHAVETGLQRHVTGIQFEALNEDKYIFLSHSLSDLSALDKSLHVKSKDDDHYVIS